MDLLHRALYRDNFWKWPALLGLAIVAAVLLAGCATVEPYWVRVYEPVAHTGTRVVDKPCGRAWAGCSSRATGVIQLWSGLDDSRRWCVLNHENKHLAGYNHPGTHGLLAYDCGNGETL